MQVPAPPKPVNLVIRTETTFSTVMGLPSSGTRTVVECTTCREVVVQSHNNIAYPDAVENITEHNKNSHPELTWVFTSDGWVHLRDLPLLREGD